jgi:hypothetical protein
MFKKSRLLEVLKTEEFPENAIAVTIDVVRLYRNISQGQAIQCRE